MKIGVLGYKDKVKSTGAVQAAMQSLQACGYQVVCFSSPAEIDGVDVLIVLGGDGAILHSAVIAAKKNIKVIGVNYGNLGFLTEFEKNEWEKVVELLARIQKGDCRIVERSLLEVEIAGRVFYALNEVAVQRDSGTSRVENPQILRLEIATREGVTTVAGDGALICTPTGSTAYSLSAGGAIITPEVPVFMLTPICAFSMRSRPTVFADDECFTVTIKKGKAAISLDGVPLIALTENTQIRIRKAPFTANFPTSGTTDFFAKVKNKLSE